MAKKSRVRSDAVRFVIATVAKAAGLPIAAVVGPSRQRDVARARHVAMALAHQWTGASSVEIGEVFAIDHSTVLGAYENVGRQLGRSEAVRALHDDVWSTLTTVREPALQALREAADVRHGAARVRAAGRRAQVLRLRRRMAPIAAAQVDAARADAERRAGLALARTPVPFTNDGSLSRVGDFAAANARFCAAMEAAGFGRAA